MACIYCFSETASAAAELISCASALGTESILVAVKGQEADLASAGATKLLLLSGASERIEDYAAAIADCAQKDQAGMFLASSTARGRELAAAVAAELDCVMFSDVSSIALEGDKVVAKRAVYGGAVINDISTQGFCVATVVSGAFEAEGLPATNTIEEYAAEADMRVERTSVAPLPKGGVDLSKAERVVGVGLGLDKQEDLELIQQLADKLGAEIGCTRDVSEGRGWLPKEQYIGITGAIIKPQLYISVGISGAMQHTYGIRDSKIVVGINKSKDAAIFRAADYGIVGDLYDVVPKLTEALS